MAELLFAIFLAAGLAACAGLRAFLPLFLVGLFFRFGVAPDIPYGHPEWIASDAVLFFLGVAAGLEALFDMVPVVDNAMQILYFLVRPMAGAAAAMAVLSPSGETWIPALLYALFLAVLVTLPIHFLSTGVRAVSTTTTAGVANPIISIKETLLSLFGTVLALLMAPLALLLLAAAGYGVYRYVRRRRRVAEDRVVAETMAL